ncbi:dihydrofolate reductase-like domain-containing protein [Lipomyces orientalis]|uniref:Dihydrofolate reductase-like domain-containing protein n=1 Tax=Lipomyces orientalis TaxID=1233043 RepID=A0ACC3TZA6_9ASCO
MTVPTPQTAASAAVQLPVALIVAATHGSLGIGRAGTLPWRLPTDMTFFRLVTSAPGESSCQPAVVMGRKSWESIPKKFRPLKNRVNVVLSRTVTDFGSGTHAFSSLAQALSALSRAPPPASTIPPVSSIYIIGGAEIYTEALKHPATSRVILTTVYADEDAVQCDTFLPDFRRTGEWEQKPVADLRRLLCEIKCHEAIDLIPVDGDRVRENGLEYEFTLWEKR